MKKHTLHKLRKNNQSVFKESYLDKIKRLEREESNRLDRAVVRRNTHNQAKGEIINDYIDQDDTGGVIHD